METAEIMTLQWGWHPGWESCHQYAGNDRLVSLLAQPGLDPAARSAASTYSLQAILRLLPAPGPVLLP